MKNYTEEKRLISEALLRFPQFDKLWMMKGQWEEREKNYNAAREVYQQGVHFHLFSFRIC